MESKQLPIADSPIESRLHITFPLAMILTSTQGLPWYHSTFIQLSSQLDFKTKQLNLCFMDIGCTWYTNCHWLESLSINPTSKWYNSLSVEEIIKIGIDENRYSITHVDEFYIANKESYQRRHFRHVIFIYGYNDLDHSFETLGYNKNGIYGKSQISYKDFRRAYDANEKIEHIASIKIKSNNHFEIDFKLIKELCEDYLYSRNTSRRYRIYEKPTSDVTYGLNVYKDVENYLSALEKGDRGIDFRLLRVLWEHKRCMCQRLKYMIDHRLIKDKDMLNIYHGYGCLEKNGKNEKFSY